LFYPGALHLNVRRAANDRTPVGQNGGSKGEQANQGYQQYNGETLHNRTPP
jgi:hypothetical protein